jgi:hypothetical protein
VLDHGHPFFVSVTDSEGASWVNGPLHAGAGSLDCFGTPPPYPWLTLGVSLGMSFSFLVPGILLALMGVWCFATRRPTQFSSPAQTDDKTVEPYITSTFSHDSGGNFSGNKTSGNNNLFSGLHLRRPSNNRARSSEMVLMSDRPSLRRDQTNATLDLAVFPTNEQYRQAPFLHNEESFPRRPSTGDPHLGRSSDVMNTLRARPAPGTAGPSQGEPNGQGTMEASLAHPTSRPSLKRHPDPNSNSSSGSPATVGAMMDTRQLSNPGAPARSSSTGPRGTQISPPRSNSVVAPVISATYGHSHQNSDPSISIVRSHSHSSSLPVNTNNNYITNREATSTRGQHEQNHQRQQQQQPMHEVYVVHHDAGLAPPVTVFTRPGTLVTELPPGYDNLVPDARPDAARANEANTTTNTNKQHSSTSGSGTHNPTPPTLEIPGGQGARPPNTSTTTRGMGLVNAEDIPLSAISSLSLRDLPPNNMENSNTPPDN